MNYKFMMAGDVHKYFKYLCTFFKSLSPFLNQYVTSSTSEWAKFADCQNWAICSNLYP